jgi:hypothetical protein
MSKTTACNRCGSKVIHFEFKSDKVVNIVSIEDMKFEAYWCRKCLGILCVKCAKVKLSEGISMNFRYGVCPVCSENVGPAVEDQMKAAFSQALKKPKGWFNKVFGRSSVRPAGAVAYLFVVSEGRDPQDSQVGKRFLY